MTDIVPRPAALHPDETELILEQELLGISRFFHIPMDLLRSHPRTSLSDAYERMFGDDATTADPATGEALTVTRAIGS